METEKNLAAPELAGQRLREAEAALYAARADVETGTVRQPGAALGEITPR
jgi:hypothetical protein